MYRRDTETGADIRQIHILLGSSVSEVQPTAALPQVQHIELNIIGFPLSSTKGVCDSRVKIALTGRDLVFRPCRTPWRFHRPSFTEHQRLVTQRYVPIFWKIHGQQAQDRGVVGSD